MKTEMMKVADIKEEFNPRSDFSKVGDLADSIKKLGLLQPVLVRKNGTGYVLVDGACRIQALKRLGIKEVTATVIDASTADEAQMAANLMRSDLNVLEKARGYERLMKTYPAKYNAASIGKAFGMPAKTVERLVAVIKRIPVTMDVDLAKFIGQIGIEDLEVIVQVPDAIKVKLAAVAGQGSLSWQISRLAKELDFSSDAMKTGALVSSGKAFAVRFRKDMRESVYTLDPKVYSEAKAAYEAQHKKEYGGEQKETRAKTEKQKEADKKERAKVKVQRDAAVKEFPDALKKFLAKRMGPDPLADLMNLVGAYLCEREIDSGTSRQVLAILGVDKAATEKFGYGDAQRRLWKELQKQVKTPEQVLRVFQFLKMDHGFNGKTDFPQWVKALKK